MGKHNSGTDAPYYGAVAVTPHDTNLIETTRGLWVGGAGTGGLVVTMANGVDCTFAGINVGYHPLQVIRVKSTGTNVTSIVALR